MSQAAGIHRYRYSRCRAPKTKPPRGKTTPKRRHRPITRDQGFPLELQRRPDPCGRGATTMHQCLQEGQWRENRRHCLSHEGSKDFSRAKTIRGRGKQYSDAFGKDNGAQGCRRRRSHEARQGFPSFPQALPITSITKNAVILSSAPMRVGEVTRARSYDPSPSATK